jgi:putative endonuclease
LNGGLRSSLRTWSLEHLPWLALLFGRLTPEELGLAAEALVARRLAAAEWRLLGRRLAAPGAELDLVALDGEILVAVEVKASRVPLSGLRFRPGERLDAERYKRQVLAIEQLARGLTRGTKRVPETRVDLVEVYLYEFPRCVRLTHHVDLDGPLNGEVPGTRNEHGR